MEIASIEFIDMEMLQKCIKNAQLNLYFYMFEVKIRLLDVKLKLDCFATSNFRNGSNQLENYQV